MTDQFQPLTGCGVLPPREDTKQRESRNNTAGGSGGIETKRRDRETDARLLGGSRCSMGSLISRWPI